MDCGRDISPTEYLRKLDRRITQLRIPFSGGFDLTSRCNLRCVHCYLAASGNISALTRPEMEKERILALLDEVRDAGCLNLLLTGGEPTIRADFSDIYAYAKRIGMLVTVFSNGTLVTKEILDLFAELPPSSIEISLYGATPETYEAVTRVSGSYRSCIRGLEGIAGIGINLTIKTVMMSLNGHEFYAIEEIAKSYGARFRFDGAVFPRLDGDKSPIKLRLPVREVVEKEFSDAARLSRAKKFIRTHARRKMSEGLYSCGAGVTNFHIDAAGHLLPCIMARNFKYDLIEGSFQDGWSRVMPLFRTRKAVPDSCRFTCGALSVCGYCPAFFRLENGDENVPSDYLCRLGKERFTVLAGEVLGKEE